MPSPRRIARNARLLLLSATQHLVDDPALLIVQVSRRLPFRLRVSTGCSLRTIASALPGGHGIAALGAYMGGDIAGARDLISRTTDSRSRLRGEVAVLLKRSDLLSAEVAPATRARAAWARGDLSGAIALLDTAGKGGSRYARRLRSELQLLSPGYRLPVPPHGLAAGALWAEDEPLRVLHVLTNSLPHTQSGYSLRTHRILAALRARGIESVAVTRTGYPVMIGNLLAADDDVVDGIRYARTLPHRLPQTQEERLLAEVERTLELVEEFHPHVIHATTNYFNALVAQAVSAATGLPWILEIRGLMEKTWAASHPTPEGRSAAASSEKARLVAAREAELATSADAVVTLSQTMVDELSARGVATERIMIVPNGVDSALLEKNLSAREARALLGIGLEGAFVVGAVSALVDYEGFDTLFRAAALIVHGTQAPASLRDRLHVVLAGDGTAAPSLRALAIELGISDRVLMPGRVSRHTARHWTQALDIVTVPRHDVEVARTVTPQKPVEAMALGRPVIVSDLPALLETVTDVDGALRAIAVPGDSVKRLAEEICAVALDNERMSRLAAQGREAASQRTWPALVQRYEKLYLDITARSQEETTRGR
ncbi:MAG: glycosyltransferase family 4 protein [Brachybacterium sp.]